jgi:hypothetical protein
MWGVDGVNYGFSYDGTNFVQIPTKMVVDQPTHLEVFANHLFYSFAGSVQHSGLNDPYTWSPLVGAGELAVGNTVTGLQVQPSGGPTATSGQSARSAMAIFSRNRIHILYGTSAADWSLDKYREKVGAFQHSIQEFGVTLMMDDRGLVDLQTTDKAGNFSHSVVSRWVQPFVITRRNRVNASCVARDKSQYRIFFSDDYALYLTMDNNKVVGTMIERFAHTVSCICSLEGSDGNEQIYFGSDDGFVYQMDKGTSFDGGYIDSLLSLNFHHSKSPRIEKSYFDASFEISGSGYSEFDFRYELGYNAAEIPQPGTMDIEASFSQAVWDTFVWDNFVWDGVILQPALADLEGDAENISLIFFSNSDYYEPIRFTGAQIRLAYRKQLRS